MLLVGSFFMILHLLYFQLSLARSCNQISRLHLKLEGSFQANHNVHSSSGTKKQANYFNGKGGRGGGGGGGGKTLWTSVECVKSTYYSISHPKCQPSEKSVCLFGVTVTAEA